MKIKLDSREPPKTKAYLEKNGLECEICTLEVGDIVCGDICIERKEIEDFVNSLRTKRLQKQMLQMQDNYKKCFVVLVGKWEKLYYLPYMRMWTMEHTLGALASINVRYNVKLIQVDNDEQMGRLIKKIIEKATDGKEPTIMETDVMVVKDKFSEYELKTKMIACIPKIGLDRAERIAKNVDIKLVNKDGSELTKRNLTRIDGIGDGLAEEILKVNKSDN